MRGTRDCRRNKFRVDDFATIRSVAALNFGTVYVWLGWESGRSVYMAHLANLPRALVLLFVFCLPSWEETEREKGGSPC
jgi:hypothetical protein